VTISHNQVWDTDGNLIHEEWVEVPDPPPTVEESLTLAARIVVADKVRGEELNDDTIAGLVSIFPSWEPGLVVAVGDLYAWDGTLVECIQAHTTQEDWTPDTTPALWKIHRTTSGSTPDPWVQPAGAHDAYNIGDRVTHNGQTWESTINANVWAPGVYGWTVIGA
jgi:hypothetical protein